MRMTARIARFALVLLAQWPVWTQAARAPQKQVIVVVGLPGAGKSTWARELADAAGAPAPLSSGDVIRAEVRARGLPYSPESETLVAEEMAHRPGTIARSMAAELVELPGEVAVVEGLRSPVELARLRKDKRFAMTVVGLQAPPEIRHARMAGRDESRYASVDPAHHQEYLFQRDRDELRRGVGELLDKADLHIDTSGSAEETRKLVRELGSRFGAPPSSLIPMLTQAGLYIPTQDLAAMVRNPWLEPDLERATLRALADIAPLKGAQGLVARLARARNLGDAQGAAYEAWAAHAFRDQALAVAVSHEGHEADLVLKNGVIGEAKSGHLDLEVVRQLQARAHALDGTDRQVLLVSDQPPDQRFLEWFAQNGARELPGGYEIVHLPLGGEPKSLVKGGGRIVTPRLVDAAAASRLVGARFDVNKWPAFRATLKLPARSSR